MGFPNRCGRGRAKGFTLLELLVVLVLVGLLAAFVLPRVGGSLPGLQLRTSARKVAATLRYAAQRAMTEQIPYAVHFGDEAGVVTLAPADTTSRIPADRTTLPERTPDALEQWQLPEDIRLLLPLNREAQTAGEAYAVTFYPGGGGSGGAVRLASPNGRQMEIQADFITSQVSIREVE